MWVGGSMRRGRWPDEQNGEESREESRTRRERWQDEQNGEESRE